MNNEKNLAKSLIISASIIGGSIILTGVMGILSHVMLGHKKPQPHRSEICCEKRIPSEHEHFKKDDKMPKNDHMKNQEGKPEFKGENKDEKPNENSEPKKDHQKPSPKA